MEDGMTADQVLEKKLFFCLILISLALFSGAMYCWIRSPGDGSAIGLSLGISLVVLAVFLIVYNDIGKRLYPGIIFLIFGISIFLFLMSFWVSVGKDLHAFRTNAFVVTERDGVIRVFHDAYIPPSKTKINIAQDYSVREEVVFPINNSGDTVTYTFSGKLLFIASRSQLYRILRETGGYDNWKQAVRERFIDIATETFLRSIDLNIEIPSTVSGDQLESIGPSVRDLGYSIKYFKFTAPKVKLSQ